MILMTHQLLKAELLNREIEYELSKAGITTYNEILQSAPLNENPISPNKLMIYSIFIGIGIFIAIVIILLVEKSKNPRFL